MSPGPEKGRMKICRDSRGQGREEREELSS
jgi:hypothetical protein